MNKFSCILLMRRKIKETVIVGHFLTITADEKKLTLGISVDIQY